MMLNHLGGGQGGIEHFLEQFTGPMTAWWKTLGSPELTPRYKGSSSTACTPKSDRGPSGSLRPSETTFSLGPLELRTSRSEALRPTQVAAE